MPLKPSSKLIPSLPNLKPMSFAQAQIFATSPLVKGRFSYLHPEFGKMNSQTLIPLVNIPVTFLS